MLEYLCKELEEALFDADNARQARDDLLKVVMSCITSDHHVDPFPLIGYVKVFYPNSYKRKMEELYKKEIEKI